MKKSSIILTAAAVAGLSGLSAAPAFAVVLPFDNCTEARNVGVFNIPIGTPGYQPGLDADGDGFGCDAAGTPPYDGNIVDRIVAENTVVVTPLATTPPVTTPPQQMREMPMGGADTGVAQAPQGDDSGALVLGGGLVLVALGGAYAVRRRSSAAA